MIYPMPTEYPVAADRQPPTSDAAGKSYGPGVKRRLGQLLATGLVAGLALFHSQLLWQRIASFTLFEPLIAVRWGTAVLLLAGFVRLQRAGVSVIWGHKALILWLLVLLCHAGMVAPVEGYQPLAVPGLLLAISLWGFALRAILGELDRLAGGGGPLFARIPPASRPPGLPRDSLFLEPLSPRPPPVG